MDIKYAYYNTSKGYRVLGGTAVHFLKADGSLDGTEYIDKTSFQDIAGTKSFYTSGGNNYDNNSLHIASSDGSDPAITFNKIGTIAGQIKMNVAGYHFLNPGLGYYPVNAAGYIKSGSDDSYVLLGGGGHMPVSSFNSSNYVDYIDNREISPSEISPLQLGYGFTAWDNNNTGPWADFLHFGSYTDASGGEQNLILFKKNGFGIRQYQGNWQDSSPYTAHVDYWHSGHFTSTDINNWNSVFNNQGNFVTLNTEQNILVRKTFLGGTGNTYDKTPLEVRGNGATDTILPAISFHQPGLYAGTINYNSEGFNFINLSASDYVPVKANAFVKNNSHDGYFLLGGGGHLPTGNKANALENATGIGFSGGIYPTDAGNEYPYMYHGSPGGNTSYVPLATQGFVTSRTNNKDGAWIQSGRNFPDGTLIKTNIDYSQTNGSAFLVEIKANMYGAGAIPMDAKIEGYIYNGTIINTIGYSTNPNLGEITALNLNGELCFWFPTMGYWHGFTVKVTDVTGQSATTINRVYAIDNVPDPGGTKRVNIPIQTLATRDWVNSQVSGSLNNYLRDRGNYNTGLVAKTDYPNSTTYYAGDPSTTGFQSYYGTSFHFMGGIGWYNRLDFPTGAEKLFLYQGINTTDMSLRGYLDVIPAEVTNWTSNNLEEYYQYGLGVESQGFGNYDLNNINKTSSQNFDVLTVNRPIGFDYGTVLTQKFVNSEQTQLAIDLFSGTIRTRGRSNGNGWTNWQRYLTTNSGIEIDGLGAISNGSDSRSNKTWFDYNWAGLAGVAGSVINFSGLSGDYAVELFGEYYSDRFGIRSHNGDANSWNPVRWLWHSGNFNPSNYVTINTPQTIIGDKRFALQPVKSDEGFQNSIYHGGRNRIWSFGNADKWGLSYQQSGFVVNGTQYREGINFHFGDENDFKVHINEVGEIFSRGTIFTDNNGNSLQWSAAYNWGNHAGAGYALANGSNASGEWLNASKALSINPYVPGRTFNASGASYLQDATYGDVNGFLNSNGIAQGNPTDNWYHRIKMLHSNSSGYFTEIGVQMTGGNSMHYRRYENGTNYGWVQVWDKENLSQANINNWNIAYGWGNHANAGYATGTWVNINFIPKSHPVYNITQANINSWNAAASGSSHTHSNLSYLNNIDQWLGIGQAPRFNSVFLMDAFGYGQLVLGEGNIGGESGLVDISNKRFYAGRINEYLKYGSSIDGFEGLNIHFDAQLLGIGRELGNHEDKVQLAGDLSVDTIDINHNSRQLILNPLYNTDGDVRHSRNAHIYIVTRNAVSLPDKPILGQRIEIFNDSDSDIEVIHSNVGTMFKIPGFCKVTGIAANKGFRFDAEPVYTKQYDI